MAPILITGAAGFVGFHLAERLLKRSEEVIGLDGFNKYYDVRLKEDRLARLKKHPGFQLMEADLADQQAVAGLFGRYRPDRVVNLAATAGVRYSLTTPHPNGNANLVGLLNVLKAPGTEPWSTSSSPRAARSMVPIPGCRFQFRTASVTRSHCTPPPRRPMS
jgi:UDP-glucuronate 4-epimerase